MPIFLLQGSYLIGTSVKYSPTYRYFTSRAKILWEQTGKTSSERKRENVKSPTAKEEHAHEFFKWMMIDIKQLWKQVPLGTFKIVM